MIDELNRLNTEIVEIQRQQFKLLSPIGRERFLQAKRLEVDVERRRLEMLAKRNSLTHIKAGAEE